MSETPTPTPADVAPKSSDTPTHEGNPSTTVNPQPDPAQDIDWKAKAREWEKRAKDNKTAADELAALKQAQMSDLERAQTEAKQNKAEAETARAEALRWRIAAKHGISDEDAETFLTGSDEATLTRQAERLASLATASAATPATPKPDLTQGGRGGTPALNGDGLEQALKEKLGIA